MRPWIRRLGVIIVAAGLSTAAIVGFMALGSKMFSYDEMIAFVPVVGMVVFTLAVTTMGLWRKWPGDKDPEG